jgi:ribosome biogenesis GTPase A
LAITGAIKDTVFDYADIALYAAEYLLKVYPDALKKRYGLEELPESDLELLDVIGIKRGCTRKGGGVEIQKVSSILITEIRAGLLGPISWETPEMTQLEVATAKAEDEKKRIEKEEADRIRRLKTKKNRR